MAESQQAQVPHHFSGSVLFGIQQDTNVNLAPASPEVKAQGFDAVLRAQDLEDRDLSGVVTANVRYVYDLQRQNDDRIETNLLFYGQLYDDKTDFNISLGNIDIGPSLSLKKFTHGATSIRPYLTGTMLTLDKETYGRFYGLGIALNHAFSTNLNMNISTQKRKQKFLNSTQRPTSNEQSGRETQLTGRISYQLYKNHGFSISSGFIFDDANTASVRNKEKQLTLGYSADLNILNKSWNLSFSIPYQNTKYAEPDTAVDPNTTRADHRYGAQMQVSTTLMDSLIGLFSYGYSKNDSNLPNYDYDNHSAKLAIIKVF